MMSTTLLARCLATTVGFLLLFSADAFPNAPGSCNSPDPTAGSHRNSAPGPLSSFNVRVTVAGTALSASSKNTVDTGKNLAFRVTSNGSFRGFLVKLYKSGVNTSTYLRLPAGNTPNLQTLSTCTNQGAASLAHTNKDSKTAIAGTLNIPSAVSDLTMEVTIVVRNSNGVSEYYTSAFAIDAKAASVGFCFPGMATVLTKDRGMIPMHQLALGDSVLVDKDGNEKNKFEPVYSFGHANAQTTAEYIQLKTASTSLELSKDHMVFVDAHRAVPASNIQVGDTVVLMPTTAASSTTEVVKSIQIVTRKGVYAPFTPSGSIVVNGMKASSFVAFQDSPVFLLGGTISTGVSYQWLARTFELPHRLWCTFSSSSGACQNEQYDEHGVSTWVSAPHAMTRWFMDQDMMTMTILSIPLVMIMSMLWALSMMMAYPIMTMISILVVGRMLHSVRQVKTV